MGNRMSLRHRLTASTHRLEAAALESEIERLPCERLSTISPGCHAVVGGRLKSVRYTPTEHVPVLQAELFDGSAGVQLVWLGRRRIPGVEPGRKMLVRGRVGVYEGQPAIYNPWYELHG